MGDHGTHLSKNIFTAEAAEKKRNQKAKSKGQKYKIDGLVKSVLCRHPGESRGPERLEITGFRLSPE
jgi:hypothetical protein